MAIKLVHPPFISTATPEDIAEEVANMSDDEQVRFLNTISVSDAGWERPWCFQLQAITDVPSLTNAARRWMEMVGEYSRPSASNPNTSHTEV